MIVCGCSVKPNTDPHNNMWDVFDAVGAHVKGAWGPRRTSYDSAVKAAWDYSFARMSAHITEKFPDRWESRHVAEGWARDALTWRHLCKRAPSYDQCLIFLIAKAQAEIECENKVDRFVKELLLELDGPSLGRGPRSPSELR